ncbi:MAG: hypothetical protein R3Y35_03175 [Clostridia bacterium]
MYDIIIAIIIIAILACAIGYIVKAKRNGEKCIGCIHSKTCAEKRKANIVQNTEQHACSGNCAHCSSCNGSNK